MNDDDEGLKRPKVFMDLVRGHRPPWIADGPHGDREPVLTDADRRFLLSAMTGKWHGVERYGDTARPTRTAPQKTTTEPAVVSHRPAKKPATARERLLARREELKAAIRRLKERR